MLRYIYTHAHNNQAGAGLVAHAIKRCLHTADTLTPSSLQVKEMGKGTFPVVFGLWLIMLTSPAHGQLSTADKQTLLNLHNRLRGSVGGANMLQSVSIIILASYIYREYTHSSLVFQVWDPELATTAQMYAERCHSAPNPSVTTATGVRRGENLGYSQGQVSLLAGAESSMQAWLNDPQSPSYTQVANNSNSYF